MVSLDSFRGKPVLLDVWATWCPPCAKELAPLSRIYEEGKNKGLVFLTIDQDEEAGTASAFLSKNGYTWPNFHDDGDANVILRSSGIPRTILVDREGKVVFDEMSSNESELRSAIAKLGPQYASLAPKPQPPACVASK